MVWFDPELAVTYRPRRSLRALARQYFEYGEWKAVVIRRYPDSAKLRQVVPAAATAAIAASLLLMPWRPRAAIVPVIYLAAVVAAATQLSQRQKVSWLHLVRIFPTMQLAWGLGFLFGAARRRMLGERGFMFRP